MTASHWSAPSQASNSPFQPIPQGSPQQAPATSTAAAATAALLANQPQMAALAAAAAAAGHYSLWPSYRAAAAAVAAIDSSGQSAGGYIDGPIGNVDAGPAGPASNLFYPYHLAAAAAMATSQMAIFQQRMQFSQSSSATARATSSSSQAEEDMPSSTTQEQPKTPQQADEPDKSNRKNSYSIDAILRPSVRKRKLDEADDDAAEVTSVDLTKKSAKVEIQDEELKVEDDV